MIASIHGIVEFKDSQSAVINVGGVGIEVNATRLALESCQIDQPATLQTRLIVREDALTLYGFKTAQERDLFDTLVKINGVGPKLAVTILSSLSSDNLRQAVVSERSEILTRVPGIGKKTAQKILLELKDKIPVGLDAFPEADYSDVNSDVMDALIALGFSVVEAQTAVQSLPSDAPEDAQERIRLALQMLSS
ncbi:Holliday junction branch migration protein RuvA [Phototrophicus methaneseepsis]|uniref:Holliday junction branch migration complex subunit RuvA n=1 Tax=Phototrophicus methaneseepsis TaxID=2710758 RepID=A0A7S8E690_9CHLR|nr:Holliday junction branch migration protein RuvA [Phototrophicus methaneseepsis]QPC81115.1 Holliday junction branch migration protein RuvA [Phototrophicus methaneseepsis]